MRIECSSGQMMIASKGQKYKTLSEMMIEVGVPWLA